MPRFDEVGSIPVDGRNLQPYARFFLFTLHSNSSTEILRIMKSKVSFVIWLAWALMAVAVSAQAQIVVSQGFDVPGFPPSGWTLSGGGGGGLWSSVNVGTFPTCQPYSGAGMARFNSRTTGNGSTQTLFTPAFDMSGIGSDTAHVRIWVFRNDSSAAAGPDYDSLEILINTIPSAVGAANIATIARDIRIALPDTQPVSGWYQYEFALPTVFNGPVNHLMFRGTKRSATFNGYRIYIDEVSFETYPAPCSGLPSAGSLTVSDTLFCTNGVAQLTLTGASSNQPGLVYQWQSATVSGGPYADFGTGLSSQTTDTLTADAFFRCLVICANTGDTAFSNEVFVHVDPSPPVLVSVADDSVTYCVNSGIPVMMIASGASYYNWIPATGLSSSFTDTVYASPVNSTTYTVTGYNTAGCSSSAIIRVTNSQSPNVSVLPVSATICQGDSITLTAVATNPGGGPGGGQQVSATFVWTPYNLIGNSITVAADSVTTVYAVGTNLAGCSGTNSMDSALVDVVTNPTAGTISVSDSVLCSGPSTVQLTLSGGSVGAYSWQFGASPTGPWTPTTNQGPTIETDTIFTPLYFICVASCPNGQTDTSNVRFVNLSNGPSPVVVLNTTQAFYCQASNPAILVAGGAPFYSWSPGTGLNSTFTDTVYAAPLQSTTYIVTGYDSLGCSDTASVRVSIRPNPVVSLAPPTSSICEGDSVTLTASAVNVGPGGTMSYAWSPLGLTGNQISISPSAGFYQVVVTGTSSFGCSNAGSIDTATITVDPVAVADFSYLVNGYTVTFTNNSANAFNYTWDFGDGSSSAQQSPVHSYANGTYDVSLVAEGSCSTDTFTVQIVINFTGMGEFDPFNSMVIPNPAVDFVTVTFHGAPDCLELIDITGKVVDAIRVDASGRNCVELEIADISPGVYFIRLMSQDGIGVTRFVKN